MTQKNGILFFCGMPKLNEVFDWYGNRLPDEKIPRLHTQIKGETGSDGRKYLRPWSLDGAPGNRIALEDSYLVIHNEQGRVVYDFGAQPPVDAVIKPGYVGFVFEEILKAYFGETGNTPDTPGSLWIETAPDGQKFVRWNVVWHDRWLIDENDPESIALMNRALKAKLP